MKQAFAPHKPLIRGAFATLPKRNPAPSKQPEFTQKEAFFTDVGKKTTL